MTSRDERGASALEYALLIAFMAAVLIVSVNALQVVLTSEYSSTCEDVGRSSSGNC